MASSSCPFPSFALGFLAASGLFLLSRRLEGRRKSATSESTSSDTPQELLLSDYSKELETAVCVAKRAGANIRSALCATSKEVSNKGTTGIDFVTETDRKNEVLIFDELKRVFPAYQFIGEETSADAGGIPALTDEPTWIVDPIDGTTNFLHTFPFTCVSIALAVNQIPVLAVVYNPSADELYLAVRGMGAYLNKKRITVSSADRISKALVLTETGYQRDEKKLDTIYSCLRAVVNRGPHSVRIMGSCVLDLCFVACGRLDTMYLGVAGEGGKIWDYAAGALLVLEAGGFVSDCFGKVGADRILHSESILASATADLHQEMAATLLKTVIAQESTEDGGGVAGAMSPLGKTLSQMFAAYT